MKKFLFLFALFFVVSTMSATVFNDFTLKEKPKIEQSIDANVNVQMSDCVMVISQHNQYLENTFVKNTQEIFSVANLRLKKAEYLQPTYRQKKYNKPITSNKATDVITTKERYKFNSFMS